MSSRLDHSEAAQEGVLRWRRDELARAGFPLPLAARIARERAWDLHALIELTERGCPPALAVRILAPLDAEAPPP